MEEKQVTDSDTPSKPFGKLVLQTVAMPKDTNVNGHIFGGWILYAMDLAGAIAAGEISHGPIATVAVDSMSFLVPVEVGSLVSCYTTIETIGHSSVQVHVEVWQKTIEEHLQKVTDGVFIYVAIDREGQTRQIKQENETGE